MNMLPDMNLIADSLGWAVLHSLWQGLLAAGIVFGARNATRECASEARYFVGIITLCALLCAFIGTFLYYYNTGAAAMSLGLGREETINLALPSVVDTASSNPLLRLGDFTGLIGLFWTVCFAVLGMRYLAAFRLTNKLRNHGISDLSADCQARFRALVDVSGVNPKVRAYFSKHVSSPITFGFLKPIILVPTWFFTGMTPAQCEAVLLHELAHIRRHDYLTNILQIAIKTVFFYHPAVGFICKGLDTDREHACDDFAVMLTKNPQTLATALGTIRLKAARDGGVFALSADGRDAPLMHRLKRLMGTTSSKTGGKNLQSGTSRGLAAAAMIGTALALVMTISATTSQAHPHKTKTENQIEAPNWEKLAGAATTNLDAWGSRVEDKITVKGKTYTATSFDFSADGKGTDTINGKQYPSKYAYSVYTRDGAKDGKSYVVKQKNGKLYMEIDGNWHSVDTHNIIGPFAMPTPPTPSTPPTPVVASNGTNYWVSDKVLAATEARAERANERLEAELERAEEMRERDMKHAEKLREKAWEKSGERREAALERAEKTLEASLERNENRFRDDERRDADRRVRDYERKIAKLERKIASKERALARDEAERDRDINRLERDIAKKQADYERKLNNNPNLSQTELGHMQSEIGQMQGEIGRIQGMSGLAQGKIGRLQGEIGSIQSKVGRIQGDWGQREAVVEQKKYRKMRDKLIPLLKADGFMKSKNNKATIKMTPTDIFINGKQLSDAQEGKYCDIVSDYISRKGDVKKIVIKPGYIHLSQNGDGHDSSLSYTFNDN